MMSGGTIQENYTDMDGRVSFSVPPAQNYQVRVSGPGVETSQSSFELFEGESFHHQTVIVKLTEDAKSKLPGGMVSAAMLNVPSKARHEYDKGMQLMEKGKLEEAKSHLQKATEIYPNFDWPTTISASLTCARKTSPARERHSHTPYRSTTRISMRTATWPGSSWETTTTKVRKPC
jgi:tetratricopeptide (TPR) repeat protein